MSLLKLAGAFLVVMYLATTLYAFAIDKGEWCHSEILQTESDLSLRTWSCKTKDLLREVANGF